MSVNPERPAVEETRAAIAQARAHVAVESKRFKNGKGSEAAVLESKLVLAEEKLAAAIEKAVAAAPPLTSEQRDRLASLLAPTQVLTP